MVFGSPERVGGVAPPGGWSQKKQSPHEAGLVRLLPLLTTSTPGGTAVGPPAGGDGTGMVGMLAFMSGLGGLEGEWFG